MSSITYTKLRENLKSALDKVVDDHEVLVVERSNKGDVVLVARDDYDSLAETAYLLRSPANARRLAEAMDRVAGDRLIIGTVADLKRASGL